MGLDGHGVEYVGGGSATDAELSSPPFADWKGNGGRVGHSVRTCTGCWRTCRRVTGKRGTTHSVITYSLSSLAYSERAPEVEYINDEPSHGSDVAKGDKLHTLFITF